MAIERLGEQVGLDAKEAVLDRLFSRFVSASEHVDAACASVGRQGVRERFTSGSTRQDRCGGDSTYMLMLGGVDGGEVAWCTPMDLYALTGRCHACQRVHVSDEAPYSTRAPAERDLSEFDVVAAQRPAL